MKTVTYKYEDIQKMVALLNEIPVNGFSHINAMAAVGQIIDSGDIKDIHKPKEEVSKSETD